MTPSPENPPTPAPATESTRFHPLFETWARRVRRRLALRHAMSGAALGLAVAIVPAAVAWQTRHGSLRAFAPLIALVGASGGLLLAHRRRWSDTDIALYLDDHLDADEAITTAVGLRNGAELDDPTRAVVVSTAASALANGDARKARPSLVKPIQLLAPVAIAAIVLIARAPLPAGPAPIARPPGAVAVQLGQVAGLEKVAKLGEIAPRDEAQKQRLEKIAEDAAKLKKDLDHGLEKREAQDRIAKLKDAIAAERLTLGEGEQRAGMESAQSKLLESELTKSAGKALGDHDLEKLDQDMERLANQREKKDRESAKKKLEEAAEAAQKGGAPGVAKALEEEKKLLDRRGKRADALRDLAKGLDQAGIPNDELRQKSEALDREGSDKAAKELADAMGKALEKLTPEERKRLADKLKEEAAKGGASGDADTLKDLAEELRTPEGQKKLQKELEDLAKEETEGSESKRQKELDDAENGAGEAEKDIREHGRPGESGEGEEGEGEKGQGGNRGHGEGEPGNEGKGRGQPRVGVPLPMEGQSPTAGRSKGTPGGGAKSGGPGGTGGTHDKGTGSHDGKTNPVDAETMKSRAVGPIRRADAMPGTISGAAPGRAGGTANVRGTGALQSVGAGEVQAVEGSDVPEEYREQVRQYFQP